jgi:hypothetical protein
VENFHKHALKNFHTLQTLQGKDDAAKRKSNFTICHEVKASGKEKRNTTVFVMME